MTLLGEYNGLRIYDGRYGDPRMRARFARALPKGAAPCAVIEERLNKVFNLPYLLVRDGYVLGGLHFAQQRNWRNQILAFAARPFDESRIVKPVKCLVDGCGELVVSALRFCTPHRRLCPMDRRNSPQALAIIQAKLDARAKRAARNAAKHAEPKTPLFTGRGEA